MLAKQSVAGAKLHLYPITRIEPPAPDSLLVTSTLSALSRSQVTVLWALSPIHYCFLVRYDVRALTGKALCGDQP